MSTQLEINNIIAGSGNFFSALTINGSGVSVGGHTHATSDITNFNSNVSGLLPVTNIVAGSNITISSSGGIYTINSTGASVTGVYEYTLTSNFPATGAASGIYIATDSNRIYRWIDSTNKYVEVGSVGGGDTSLWNLFLPGAPTNLTGTPASGQVTLSWTAPTGVATQTPITDYVIQYSGGGTNNWTTFNDSVSSATSGVITGLTNGSGYIFRTAGINIIGTGTYSAQSSSITPIVGDTYWANVELLLHCDGSNNGTVFSDSSSDSRTVTRGGTPVTVTNTKKFGTASAYFSQVGDYLSVADAASLEFGGNDFVIEMWILTTNSSQYSTLFSRTPNSFNTGMYSLMMNHNSSTAGDLAFYVYDANGGTTYLLLGGSGLRDGTWHHIAVSRSGSTWNMYIDGTRVSTTTNSSTIADIAGDINIARDQFYGRQYIGYIDDLRLTVGSARGYTGATITVPSTAFPDS